MKTARLVSFIVVLTHNFILSPAWAGWSTTSLQPAGNYVASVASSVSRGEIGGTAIASGGQLHPGYWLNASPSSFVDLFSSAPGQVLAVGTGMQVGIENTVERN